MLIIIIILILLLPACDKAEKDLVKVEAAEESKEVLASHLDVDIPIDSRLSAEEEISSQMKGFLKILTPETTTAELKSNMEANIQYVSKKEAEKMLEFLLIYQTETIDDFIITEAFFDQVYDGMDESSLESILDEKVRADYKMLLDSSLRAQLSENHIYIATDWKSLKIFSPYLPQVYDEIFNLYIEIENYEYDEEEVAVAALGQDIIKTESIIRGHHSGFLKKISNELCEAQLYNLLLGPEGSHVYLWEDKNNKEYDELMKLSEQYPESTLAQIIDEIDQTPSEEISDASNIIRQYLAFGLESKNHIETVSYSEGQGDYELIQVKIPGDGQKENKINNIIKIDINRLIEEEDIKEYFYISTDLKYADEKYISYEVQVSYSDRQGNEDYKYFYRTLDYLQEEYITLEEYLGVSFDSIKDRLEEIVGEEIDSSPEVLLFAKDISLFSGNQEAGTRYIGSLHLKDITLLRDPYKT